MKIHQRFTVHLVWAAAALSMALSASPAIAEPDACEQAISASAAKYAQARTKALAKCELGRISGKLPYSTNCSVDPKTAAALSKASEKLTAAIGKACGGDDKLCGGDMSGEDLPASVGWPSQCPNFLGGSCTNSISDCADITTCLTCIHDSAISDHIGLFFSALAQTDPESQAELNKCQQAFGKASAGFLRAKTGALQKCWSARLKGKHSNPCPDPGDGKAVEKIAAAEAKRAAAICKACGGDDKTCDGVDDFSAVDILGSEVLCPTLQDPDGIDCGTIGLIDDIGGLVECGACLTSFQATCIDRSRVPQVASYPSACALPPRVLVSVEVTPIDSTLALSMTQQFVATGTYSDTSTEDLTSAVDWASSDTNVAMISNADGSEGVATGIQTGSTTISATLASFSDSTTLTVSGGAALSYSANVQPILQSKCAPCHTSLGSGGANLASSYAATQFPSYYCSGETKGGCTIVRVQNGSMPQGAGCTGDPNLDAGNPACLTAAQQSTLQLWILQGQLP